MKKILIIFFLTFILTWCFFSKEEKTYNNQVKQEVILKNITNKKTPIWEVNWNSSFNSNTVDFILKLEKNPDILKTIDCEKIKEIETKALCSKKKYIYLNESTKIKNELIKKEKAITSNTVINKKNISSNIIKSKDVYIKWKNGYIKWKEYIVKFVWEKEWNKFYIDNNNSELISFLSNINNDNNILKSINCNNFKIKETISFCKEFTKKNLGNKKIEVTPVLYN